MQGVSDEEVVRLMQTRMCFYCNDFLLHACVKLTKMPALTAVRARIQMSVLKIVAGILHLGNVKFEADDEGNSSVENDETLEDCGELFSVRLCSFVSTMDLQKTPLNVYVVHATERS